MANFDTLTKNTCRAFDYVAAACFVMIMAVGVTNIFLRAVFSRPLPGTVELIGMFSAIGISAALAYSAYNNGQIAVTIFLNKLPRHWRNNIDVFINLISLVFWGTAVFFVLRGAQSAAGNNLITASLRIPIYPIMCAVAVGLVLLCMVFLTKIVRRLGSLAK